MFVIPSEVKQDPERRWALPDRIFFACGACHILAYAFLEAYPGEQERAVWQKPAAGFTGNHIFVEGEGWIFDYHGYSEPAAYHAHTRRKARRWWPGWEASLHELAPAVLVSEGLSRTHEGLWLREPRQFLHDALPRARTFLRRFPAPCSARPKGRVPDSGGRSRAD